jgi:hypothetical protein
VECTKGAPPLDPNKQAQLDGEYSEFSESLKEFDVVSKRIGEMASLVRLQIRPSNQPSTEDPPDAMGLYSKLNGGLAESCPEPARSCLRSYEAYQTCEASAGSKECGTAPSCSAVCAVAPQVIRGLKAGVCESPREDSASLFPDWSEILKKEDAARATNPKGQAGASKENTDPGSCSVSGEYRLAQTRYYVEKGVQVMGSGGGKPPEGNVEKGSGVIRVSGAVAQGILLKRVDPVYPAVARAAHVTGSVVLHAIISKEGKVVEVMAVSGPDLLRSAAVTAVSQWVYRPYLLNGTPTAMDTLVTVNFNF